MKPIRTIVLVRPFPSDEISTGGIHIPESARQVNNRVEIISVGNGTRNKPMKFTEGQVVFRVKDWGSEVIINGEKHYLMDQDAILATE